MPEKRLFEGKNCYDGMELTLWGFFDRNWDVNLKRLKKIKERGVSIYTFHGSFETVPRTFKGYYLNIARRDSFIIKAIKSHIDVAYELGGENPVLTFHPGTLRSGGNKERALGNILKNIELCLDYAASKNITLALENMDYVPGWCTLLADHFDFEYVFKRIKHDNLKITFDWGHLNTQARNKEFCQKHGFSKQDLMNFKHINEFITEMNKNIVHAHIHYNRSHQFLGPYQRRQTFFGKMLLYLFFWTDISKFLRKGLGNVSVYDDHLPLNRIEEQYLEKFSQTIKNLLSMTSVKYYGYITHEISPRKIFKYFIYSRGGAEYEDFLKSLELFKKLLK
jgi:sugar phosphate isomerase/epimerase